MYPSLEPDVSPAYIHIRFVYRLVIINQEFIALRRDDGKKTTTKKKTKFQPINLKRRQKVSNHILKIGSGLLVRRSSQRSLNFDCSNLLTCVLVTTA